jgi:hypothetical protein
VSGEAAGFFMGRWLLSRRVESGVTGFRSAELLLRVRKDGVADSSLYVLP